ncbi:DUF883 family protein [Pantoea sp. Mhis]|uniref:glycine zipper domain-containing protein n=1 Tax=Pantoea sp. Mhis TaxID=2576759 RepID=UPI001356C779|nr:DUF883 family protein [Pantoea sp. Mhis]
MAKDKFLNHLKDKIKLKLDKLYQKTHFPMYKTCNKFSKSGKYIKQNTFKIIKKADHLIHKKPWQSAVFSTTIGVIIGILISRRS